MSDELAGDLQLENDEDMAREVGYYVLRKMERDGLPKAAKESWFERRPRFELLVSARFRRCFQWPAA